MVNELLLRPDLLSRALGAGRATRAEPALLLRYTRVLFTQPLKQQLVDYLGYGLALEAMSVVGAGKRCARRAVGPSAGGRTPDVGRRPSWSGTGRSGRSW